MATKGDITANVGINVAGGGIDGVISNLDSKVMKLIRDIEKIGNTAGVAQDKAGKGALKALEGLDNKIKALSIRLSQMEQLSKVTTGALNVKSIIGTDLNDQKIAKNIAGVVAYRRSMEESVGTAEKLRTRINDITKETTKLGQAGQTQTAGRLRQQETLTKALKDYETLSSKISGTQTRIALLSPESQKKMESLVLEGQRFKGVLDSLVTDGRRFDFSKPLENLRLTSLEMDKQIGLLKAQETASARINEKTRQRAVDLINLNKQLEQKQLESSGRKAFTNKSFANVNTEAEIAQRLERATVAYNRVKTELSGAVDNGASPKRLDTLIQRYETLRRVIAETIASQARLNIEQNNSGKQGFQIFETKARQIKQSAALDEKAVADEAKRGFQLFEAKARQINQNARLDEKAANDSGRRGHQIFEAKAREITQANRLDQKNAEDQARNASRLFDAKVRQIALLERLNQREAAEQARNASKLFEARASQLRQIAALEDKAANDAAKKAHQQFEAYARLKAQQAKLAEESAKPPPTSGVGKAFAGLLGDGGAGLGARVGIYALASSAIYGVMNAAKEAAQFVIKFEDTLATLQAISGSTDSQMASLSNTILEVSKSSRYSAVEIAEATTTLAQAGFSANDVQKSLQSITDFAAASGTPVKESVDLMTGALGAFQLQASDTARIADVMVAALNRSKLTSTQIAQAIQYVGTTAYEQNVSLEQLVATIGSVAQAGVRSGSTLGTGFRQFLVDLANPTEKLTEQLTRLGLSLADVDVKTKGIPAVLNTLKDAGFGAAQAYQGLEVRAAAFYLAAKNNVDVSQQLMLAESQRGVASEAAARAMDSLSAQTQRFYNILAKLAFDNAPLDYLKELIKQAADLAENIAATGAEYEELKKAQDRGMAPEFVQYLQTQAEVLYKNAQEAENLEDRFFRLVGISSSLGENSVSSAAQLDKLATASANAGDESAKQAEKIASANKEFERLLLQGPSIRDDSIATAIETNNLTGRFQGLSSMLGTTANGYDNLVIAMRRYNAEQLKVLGQKASAAVAAGNNEVAGLKSTAVGQLGNIRRSAGFQGLSGAQQSQFNTLLSRLNRAGGLSAMNDFVARIPDVGRGFQDLKKQINSFTVTIGNTQAKVGETRANRTIAQDSNLQSNPVFRKVADGLSEINANIGRAMASAPGQTAKQREAAFSGSVSALNKGIGYIDALIAKNKGNVVAVRNLQGIRGEYSSALTGVRGTVKPTSAETKADAKSQAAGARAASKEAREAKRAQDTFNSNELSVSQAKLKATDKTLSAFLNGQGVGFNFNKIPELFAKGDEALDAWVAARREVLADAITKAGLTPAQITELTGAADEEIKAKQKATIERQVQVIDKAVSAYITRMGKSIEGEYRRAVEDPTNTLGIQQGLSTGLSNPLLKGRIPASTAIIQNRRVAEAQDALDRTNAGTRGANGLFSGGANETRIAAYEKEIEDLQKAYEELDLKVQTFDPLSDAGKAGAAELSNLSVQLRSVSVDTDALRNANEQLRASLSAGDLAPTTLAGGLAEARDAFNIENDIGISLTQRTINGMGGALDSVHSSFQDFFSSILTGTSSVGAAFGGMAKAVIGAITEMAAKAVATQIFGLLLSFIPGASNAGASIRMGPSGVGAWNGGMIGNQTPKRLIGGGPISSGLPTRDSTLVHAAKGEFMMRRSSVESIGHDLLQDMNNRGASALSKLGGGSIVMPQSQLNSNVYVQLPEEKSQLGPNDVLAIVSRDVLRGGATKALIKQVSSGG